MKRILTALALIIGAVYLVWFASTSVFIAATLSVGALCYWEFSGLVMGLGIRRPGVAGLLIGAAIILFPDKIIWISFLFLVVQMIWLLQSDSLRDIVPEGGAMFLGAFYSFSPWHFAVELRHISVHLLFFALALNWVGDSAAYYVGRQFGKHKLAPLISPGKSWEGAAASVAGSICFGLMYLGNTMPKIPLWAIVGLAALGNISGQFGDLFESAVKRGAGLKDSGNLLPGHGGVLDRLDSSMFAVPVVYALYVVGSAFHF